MKASIAICAAALSAASCGGSSGASLDCAYLASNNCYKTTLAAAASCLPPSSAQGVLSSDNTSCSLSTGQTVTFDSALTLPLPNNPTLAFTVKNGGTQCARVQYVPNSSFSLTTSAGATSETTTAQGSLTLTCPDGKSYSNNALALLQCIGDAGQGLTSFPGVEYSSTSTSIQVTLFGAGTTDGTQAIFSCSK
jgi:hypothetical protein